MRFLAIASLMLGLPHPSESVDLGQIRDELESTLSRIKTVHILYTEGPGASVDAPGATGSPSPGREHDLLYSPPSLRHFVTQLPTDDKSSTKSSVVRRYVYNKKLLEFDDAYKRAYERDAAVERDFPDPSPLNALGLRLRGSIYAPITQMLQDPSFVIFEKNEVVRGREAIVLKIGPNLPATAGPLSLQAGNFARLWLAPSLGYLPIRQEYYIEVSPEIARTLNQRDVPPGFAMQSFELDDFQPASDEARDETVLLPRTMILTTPSDSILWRIRKITLNPPVNSSSFRASIPDGYLVSRDGAPPMAHLAGGKLAREKAVAQSELTAQKLLASAPPARSGSAGLWSHAWRLLVPAAFVIMIVSVLLLRRRV